jgi:uncharacterized membrane protein YecN with MAPEG domain
MKPEVLEVLALELLRVAPGVIWVGLVLLSGPLRHATSVTEQA